MPVYTNVQGTWVEVTQPIFNVDGTNIDLTQILLNVNGDYKSVWEVSKVVTDDHTYLVLPDATSSDISRAINAMSEGGTLLFGDGTWNFTGSINIRKSNVNIIGNPKTTTFIRSGDSKNGMFNVEGDVKGVRIYGIIMDGNMKRSSYSGPAVAVRNTKTEGSVSIENCVIKSVNGPCIYIDNSKGCTIVNNNLKESSNGVHLVNSQNNTVTKNNIRKNLQHGVLFEGSSGNNLSENHLTGNALYGAVFGMAGENPSNRNTIQNNHVLYSTISGLVVKEGCSGNIIRGNSLNGNGSYGIRLSGHKNVMQSNWSEGHTVNDTYLDELSTRNLDSNNFVQRRPTPNNVGENNTTEGNMVTNFT